MSVAVMPRQQQQAFSPIRPLVSNQASTKTTPVAPKPAPVAPKPTPVTPKQSPVAAKPAPKPTPVAAKPAPKPAPVAAKPAPKPAPVTPKPTPVTPKPTPVTPKPAPVAAKPAPKPTPVTPKPTPVAAKPAPNPTVVAIVEPTQKFTYPIAPVEDNRETPVPDGFIQKSCLLKCIDICEKKDSQPGGMNLLESPQYPQPLPMAPRETFDNFFLKRDFLNSINDPNVDYRYNMDLTVDYETTNTTPFAPKPITAPPNELGQTIPVPPPIRNITNEVLEASGDILPPLPVEIPTMSRADVPIADMIQMNYSGYSKVVKEYMSSIGKSLGDLYATLSKNDAISGIFKDNIKIISVLIAVAAGSFIVNAGFSAIVVGLILLFVTKNASGLF